MKFDATEQRYIEVATGHGRLDLYVEIHKALRAWMSHVLVRVGQMDSTDDEDCRAVVSDLGDLLDTLQGHLETENAFVHPAIEARRPGAIVEIEDDHREHQTSIDQLHHHARAMLCLPTADREASALFLYRELAFFVGENLQHMQVEETLNNQLLWSAYSDEELQNIHVAILSSIPPKKMAGILYWMLPAIAPAARAHMLTQMCATMPVDAFAGVLDIAQSRLESREWTKLTLVLGLPQVPGLVNLSRQ